MNQSDKQVPPPNIPKWLFPLTSEEESLLEMFNTVKALEREAKIRASIAARAKLVAPDEKSQRDQVPSKGAIQDFDRFESEREPGLKDLIANKSDMPEDQSVEDVEMYTTTANAQLNYGHDQTARNDEHVNQETLKQQQLEETRRRQRAKLEILRSEHEATVKKKEQEEAAAKAEEEMRRNLLMTVDNSLSDSGNLGRSLKKKQQRNWEEVEAAEAALVETMAAEAAAREANNFDTKLKRKKKDNEDELENADAYRSSPSNAPMKSFGFNETENLGVSCFNLYYVNIMNATTIYDFFSSEIMTGSIIFPNSELSSDLNWTPPPTASNPQDCCLVLPLLNIDSNVGSDQGPKNTIAITFLAPSDSKRFRYVLNIVCLRNSEIFYFLTVCLQFEHYFSRA